MPHCSICYCIWPQFFYSVMPSFYNWTLYTYGLLLIDFRMASTKRGTSSLRSRSPGPTSRSWSSEWRPDRRVAWSWVRAPPRRKSTSGPTSSTWPWCGLDTETSTWRIMLESESRPLPSSSMSVWRRSSAPWGRSIKRPVRPRRRPRWERRRRRRKSRRERGRRVLRKRAFFLERFFYSNSFSLLPNS